MKPLNVNIDKLSIAMIAEPAMLKANPERQPIYSSKAMQARRRRILREVRSLIAEFGIEGFSVRELCRRAEIAQRTLYEAFHSKERVIALALREAYDAFFVYQKFVTDPETLEGFLDRLIRLHMRNLEVRKYTKALVATYFAPGLQADVKQSLYDMSANRIMCWLKPLAERGLIEPWVDLDHLVELIVRIEFSVVSDWCNNVIPDKEFLLQLVAGVLVVSNAAVRDPMKSHIRELLVQMHASGDLPFIAAESTSSLRLRP